MRRLLLLTLTAALAIGPAQAQEKALWPVRGAVLRLPSIPWPNWKPGHRGIDIAVSVGHEVHSPVDGRVVWVGQVARMPSISILANGLRFTLQPVSTAARVGDWVQRGEQIATAAASNHCGKLNCLHWSVRRGPDYLDPRWIAEPLLRRGSPR